MAKKLSAGRSRPTVNNPVPIKGTKYSYILLTAKGNFAGKSFAKARRFILFHGKKRITRKAVEFPLTRKTVSGKKSYIESYIVRREIKLRLVFLQKAIDAKASKLAAAEKKSQRSKDLSGYKKYRITIQKLDRELYDLDLERKRLKAAYDVGFVRIPEKVAEKRIIRKVFSANRGQDLTLGISIFTHAPCLIEPKNLSALLDRLKHLYMSQVAKVLKQTKPSQREFIFRILYRFKHDDNVFEQGIGRARKKLLTATEFNDEIDQLIQSVVRKMYESSASYFKKGYFPAEIEIFGFTIENIKSKGRALKPGGGLYQKRLSLWNESRQGLLKRKKKRMLQTVRTKKKMLAKKKKARQMKRVKEMKRSLKRPISVSRSRLASTGVKKSLKRKRG